MWLLKPEYLFEDTDVKRIQLWSDEKEKEFAICFSGANGAFFTRTNPHAQYVKMVEEAEYVEGEKYDWEFMLAKWIEGRNGNGITTWVPHIPDGISHTQPREAISQKAEKRKRKKYTKQTATLKCRFCGLMYVSERERDGHEKEWHTKGQKTMNA